MAKVVPALALTLALALGVLLLIIGAKATLHATVEIDELKDENQGTGKCMQEFMSQHKLMACRQFMRAQISSPGRIYEDEEEEEAEISNKHKFMNRCCDELRQMDGACVCPSLKMATEMMQHRQTQFGGKEMEEMYGIASRLPTICSLRYPVTCPFGQTWEF